MREIEFRAKDRLGKWRYGYLLNNAELDGAESKNLYIRDKKTGVDFSAIPETVGQFTGLKDKNGVEIYEGDIFHLGDGNITYTVVWHDIGLIGKQNGSSSYVGLEHWKERIKIVGNIHDKHKQKQALIDMMRGDEEIGLYDDNTKNH